MTSEAYVDLRHLVRIADDVDNLSSCVIRVAIKEIEYKRKYIKDIRTLLKDITQDNIVTIDNMNLIEELLAR